jgi:energy-coupling factor transport system permease protein
MQATLAWLTWTLCTAVLALMIRNPLYLTLIALAAWLVYITVSDQAGTAHAWSGLLKLGLFIWAVTIPFNALMIHQGNYVLFRLPEHWPLVGGAITLEAVLYGLTTGFALWTLLLVFAAFNVAVDASQLLRAMPPFLYQAGVVTSIALTFLPQMLSSAQEIREAQQIRGHRFRGLRDLPPLLVPLLTTALERAIQLAESMESRGFGGQTVVAAPALKQRQRLYLLASLGLLLIGFALRAFWFQRAWVGTALILVACVLMGGVFYSMNRLVQRSRYARRRWQTSDSMIVASSLAALAAALAFRLGNRLALTYYPYPPYPIWPGFDARLGAALMLLAAPALVHLFIWNEAVPPRSGSQPLQDEP